MRHQTIKILWKMPNSCSPNVRPNNNNTKNRFSDFQNSNSDLFQNRTEHKNEQCNLLLLLDTSKHYWQVTLVMMHLSRVCLLQ